MVNKILTPAGQARLNKKVGAKFEGDVRMALRTNNQFVYTKASSCPGIDILALKENRTLFAELKTHGDLKNHEYTTAQKQFKENEKVVDEYLRCTKLDVSLVKYVLIYYIRNEKLIINDIHQNKIEFDKNEHRINILDFIHNSLISYNIV